MQIQSIIKIQRIHHSLVMISTCFQDILKKAQAKQADLQNQDGGSGARSSSASGAECQALVPVTAAKARQSKGKGKAEMVVLTCGACGETSDDTWLIISKVGRNTIHYRF